MLAVFLLEILEVADGELDKVFKMILDFLHLRLDAAQFLIHRLDVKLRDLSDRFLYKSVDVFHDDRPLQKLLILEHLIKHFLQLVFPCPGISFENLIYLVLEENLFERVVMPVVLQFIQPDLEFKAKEVAGMLCTVSEHVVDAKHLRLVVENHACVRGNRNLAGGECIECIYGLVWRYIVRKMDHDVHLVCGEVINLLYLYLAGFLCLKYGFNHYRCGLAERDFRNGKGVLVDLLDLCADLDLAALALAAVL